MRKLAFPAVLLMLSAAHLPAQRGGARGGGGVRGPGRAGIHSGIRAPGRVGIHRGFPVPGSRFGYRGYSGFYRPFYGYSWPIYVGGYSFYDPYPYSSYAQPVVTVVDPTPPDPAPPVVVTQYLAPPVHIPIYQPAPAREPEPEPQAGPALYLIAFHSGVIRAAVAYWTDGGKLHYVDMSRKPHSAALDTVDRELSARLNRERRVPFRLP